MTYARERITSADDGGILMSGVDRGVYHGYVKCGATGTITGIGNVISKKVLHFVSGGQNFRRLVSSRARWWASWWPAAAA